MPLLEFNEGESAVNRKDFFAYIFWFVFFIAVFIWASSLIESAAFWPKFVSIIGLGLSGIGILRYILVQFSKNNVKTKNPVVLTKALISRSSLLLVTMILWIVLMKPVGFLVSSLIAVNAIVFFFQTTKAHKRQAIHFGITSVLIIGMYIVFLFLGVQFPAGILI